MLWGDCVRIQLSGRNGRSSEPFSQTARFYHDDYTLAANVDCGRMRSRHGWSRKDRSEYLRTCDTQANSLEITPECNQKLKIPIDALWLHCSLYILIPINWIAFSISTPLVASTMRWDAAIIHHHTSIIVCFNSFAVITHNCVDTILLGYRKAGSCRVIACDWREAT
jgi:hypothetical protein